MAVGVSLAYGGRYRARTYTNLFGERYLGTFDTPERASVAVRLFEHWVAAGHDVNAIPRQPRTRDAI